MAPKLKNGKTPIYHFAITNEERIWMHLLALKNKSTIPTIIIESFEQKSKELGVPIPQNRVKRKSSALNRQERERLIIEYKKELVANG